MYVDYFTWYLAFDKEYIKRNKKIGDSQAKIKVRCQGHNPLEFLHRAFIFKGKR